MHDNNTLRYEYSPEKSALLEQTRSINFAAVITLIEAGNILDVFEHPNQQRYPLQKIYALDIGGYVYLVPFIQQENVVFLKTIFPSRRATKQYEDTLKKELPNDHNT